MEKPKLIYDVGDLKNVLEDFNDSDGITFTINSDFKGEDVEMYISKAVATDDKTDVICHIEIVSD